jgi:putative sugar O-methyltransferase
MFLIYLEMFHILAKMSGVDAEMVLSGNYLDIGGGYGSSVDGMAIYKKFRGIGASTVNYDVDQFPVTFIANQYLRYRHPEAMCPVLAFSNDLDLSGSPRSIASSAHSFLQVIQNNLVDQIKGANISFFFNSNSFQEMDIDQVEEYCRFIECNKAAKTYLGVYFYDSDKTSNDPAKACAVLSSHFKQIGHLTSADLFTLRGLQPPTSGVVKGTYRLFAV